MLSSIKKHGKKIVAGTLVPFMISGGAKAISFEDPGYLKITNNLNSHSEFVNIKRDEESKPGATDGYDNGIDGLANSNPDGYPNIYTNIITHNLWGDVRPNDSVTDYDIRLSFSGGLPSTQSNWLDFSFYVDPEIYKFGEKPIIFQSDNLLYGYRADVRGAIDWNSGNLDLEDVVVGTTGEYASGELEIGTDCLGNINNDPNGNVDYVDFALLSRDWLQGPGKYPGDIYGPNGVPDGFVDMYDLEALAYDWGE